MTIEVTPSIHIMEDELEFHFFHASGPGGQHVNKAATAVRLRFNIEQSSLPDHIQRRLRVMAGNRINQAGELLITAQQHRSQRQNREDAQNQLMVLIRKAARMPRKRKKTRPSRAAMERRLEAKRRQGQKKRSRQRLSHDDY